MNPRAKFISLLNAELQNQSTSSQEAVMNIIRKFTSQELWAFAKDQITSDTFKAFEIRKLLSIKVLKEGDPRDEPSEFSPPRRNDL